MEEIGRDKEPMLILLDLSLPKMSGMEILEKIQESKDADYVEVVVITGSQKESDRAKSYAYGVKTFMKKDIVCDNCIKLICGDEADKCVAKAFNDAYEEAGGGKK
jgi:CheY-like chemotaxis protein